MIRALEHLPLFRLTPHIRYFWYVVRHKVFVFYAGILIGAPPGVPVLRHLLWWWQLAVHDLSKFRPSEWRPYVAFFYGPSRSATSMGNGEGESNPDTAPIRDAFNRAWLLHQHRNPHHWQHWLLRNDQPPPPPRVAPRELWLARSHPADRYVWEDLADLEDKAFAPQHYDIIPLEMPERYVREMVADWAGAGRAITGRWDLGASYYRTRHNQILAPETAARVDELVRDLRLKTEPGYRDVVVDAMSIGEALRLSALPDDSMRFRGIDAWNRRLAEEREEG